MLRTCPGRPEVQKKPSCATMGPIEHNSRTQTVVSGPRLNDVHVLSRPLAYPAVHS